MSLGINRFFIKAFGCDGFGARRRVLREVRREKEWSSLMEQVDTPKKPRRVLLKGCELAAYFFIIYTERNPVIFLLGIPVAVGLYLTMILSYLI